LTTKYTAKTTNCIRILAWKRSWRVTNT